jgi:hypothetical protein
MMRILLSGFIAGALSVVIFHQGSAFLLHHIGNEIPAMVAVFGKAAAPFNMAPTKPLGVPAIASQCFWGGVWGGCWRLSCHAGFSRPWPLARFSALLP